MGKSSATFCLHTFGCKVNQYESQLLREELLRGKARQATAADAAWHVVNGCVVTQNAQAECRRLVRRLQARFPGSSVLITGCLASLFRKYPDLVPSGKIIVAQERSDVAQGIISSAEIIARKKISTRGKRDVSRTVRGFAGHTRAFVKIQDGCDRWCSYCIVPHVRGRSRSKPFPIIVKEVKNLGKKGFKEIVLTGIDLGAWGKDITPPEYLSVLARELHNIKEVERIRLSSLEIHHVTPLLIEEFKSNAKLCSHAHIPLQSGDDEVLKRMNRTYTAREYGDTIMRLRQAVPGMAVSTDIMVGFPGETEAQFTNTLNLCRRLDFMRVHVFPYSVRPQTAAARLGGGVPLSLSRRRAEQVRAVVEKTSFAFRRRMRQHTQTVLIEEQQGAVVRGYTGTYIPVTCVGAERDMVGTVVSVRITRVSERATEGKIL